MATWPSLCSSTLFPHLYQKAELKLLGHLGKQHQSPCAKLEGQTPEAAVSFALHLPVSSHPRRQTVSRLLTARLTSRAANLSACRRVGEPVPDAFEPLHDVKKVGEARHHEASQDALMKNITYAARVHKSFTLGICTAKSSRYFWQYFF